MGEKKKKTLRNGRCHTHAAVLGFPASDAKLPVNSLSIALPSTIIFHHETTDSTIDSFTILG